MSPSNRILVVENNTAIADLIVEVLVEEGYRAYGVPDMLRARAAIAHQLPALILLDKHTLDMGSAKWGAEWVIASQTTLPIVLMITSGHGTPALAAEFSAYLNKPFRLDELLACVARYVQPALHLTPVL